MSHPIAPGPLNRRELLARTAVGTGAALLAGASAVAAEPSPPRRQEPFGYSLNTSTIRGADLTLPEKVRIAAKAG